MYFVGSIQKNDGTEYNRIIEASDLLDAHDKIEKYVKRNIEQFAAQKLTNYARTKYLPFQYTGVFTVRRATPQEAIEDLLKDFAGNWNEYNISAVAEEIIEIVKGDGSA